VAGQLVCREQRITSRAGKEHLLQVYVRPGDLDKTEHAMNSLMASVAWDEARFGLSLDLERFMIVATSDFNMGAMENKGLNIFNTKYVLASQATATDTDFANIESVVGHEYFHNWTGNRVTCRDWFQLSLKEGLTVFRDQEFSQDLCGEASARAVKRIEDVRVLRTAQFPEDAGPMAHPVRPDSYLEINNFYTVTIYEKGAEVVRMMQTLTGREGFAKGMKLYFERHDGQAVTCDDFAQAIADANPGSPWPTCCRSSSAGTARPARRACAPRAATTPRRAATRSACRRAARPRRASRPRSPSSSRWPGPGGPEGATCRCRWPRCPGITHLCADQSQRDADLEDIAAEPVPSLLRGFSAPVILDYDYTDAQLLALLAHDTDPFNRWEAGQRLALRRAAAFVAPGAGPVALDDAYVQAMRGILRHPTLDAAFKELVLTLPAETYIAEQLDVVDPQRIHAVREAMRLQLAQALHDDWAWAFDTHRDNGAYRPTRCPAAAALAGLALATCAWPRARPGDTVWPGKAYQRFKDAGNMTDRFNALAALVSSGHRWPSRRCSASMPCSRTSRWCWTSGSRCRPARRTAAAMCCRPCAN
jgi:aminopeptidase N